MPGEGVFGGTLRALATSLDVTSALYSRECQP